MTLDSNNTVDLRSKEVLWTGKIVYIDIYIYSFFFPAHGNVALESLLCYQWCSGRFDCRECERWYTIDETLKLSHSFFSVGMTV